MTNPNPSLGKFFKVIVRSQSYLNLIYLLAAFPLGVLYFVFLVSGLSTGISLAIIWIGIPILVLVGAAWWLLASFERSLAIYMLKEDVPAMTPPFENGSDIWTRFKVHFTNPVTWKSLLYLFLKFPLGIVTLVIVVVLLTTTIAFLTMPFTYQSLDGFQIGLFFTPDQPLWRIDSLSDALLAAAIGLILWPVTLHITNGLAWIHAKFARLMLSIYPQEAF
jgi:hypothetical protein